MGQWQRMIEAVKQDMLPLAGDLYAYKGEVWIVRGDTTEQVAEYILTGNKRWECSLEHYQRYEDAYLHRWALEVTNEATA